MKYTTLPKLGIRVSRFGLGGMRLPKVTLEDGTQVIEEKSAIELVRKTIDGGVNYVDTAYVYSGSEELFGKALRDGYREKVYLATKLPVHLAKSYEDMERILDEELRRLQTDYIDFYLLHDMSYAHWKVAEELDALGFMRDMREKGKIKYICMSIHDWPDHFKKAVDAFDWDMVMVQYNYYDRLNQAGQDGVRYVASKGIPLVTMESLHGGMLACNVPEKVRAAFGGWRAEQSDAELALTWLIDQPEVSVILSGISSLEQLEENLAIFDRHEAGELTERERELYERARLAWKEIVKIPCTGCAYCMPCPRGVEIPGIFEQYNHLARAGESQALQQKWLYDTLYIDREKDASRCVACGACEKKCPQGIKIIERLREAAKELAV